MRKKIAAANWKMNTNLIEGEELMNDILKNLPSLKEHQQVIFFPPFTHLALTGKQIDNKNCFVGAQNCSQFDKGAFTGEISCDMIKATNGSYVLVGHSERRSIFVENDKTLKEKANKVIAAGLQLIFCCGETLDERERNNQFNIVKEQLQNALFQLTKEEIKNTVIAYEPVWAIGTGKTASPQQAQEMHAYIRSLLIEFYDNEVAMQTSILYGGSVNGENASELFAQPDIDGGLVGGASLKPTEFLAIIAALS